MESPIISVIMPVFNSAAFLKDAIESILNQTFTDFEFLIFDDGSTDNSSEIIKSYTDKRIVFFEDNINKGYTPRLNNGLKIAKGKYIARMDSDDISELNRFQKQVYYMEINPSTGLCGSFMKFIGSTRENFENWVQHSSDEAIKVNLLFDCAICHPTVMLRKSVLDKNNINYNVDLEPGEDYDLWVRMSKITSFYNIPVQLLNYRLSNNQVTVSARNYKQHLIKEQLILAQLLSLGIKPTQTELFLHKNLYYSEVVLSADFLLRLRQWCNKLIEANQKAAIYNNEILTAYLNNKYENTKNNLNKRIKSLNFIEKTKLKLKYILGWKSFKA